MDRALSTEDKRSLCEIAREAIAARLQRREPVSRDISDACLQSGGAFVTLHENGQLRGCIGRMQSSLPLAKTVRDMALAAAFEDPRFEPLSGLEYPEIDIEITILGPMRRIFGENDFTLGLHGLYIAARGRVGVLLPQVATENGWDSGEFLDHLCLKAGLPISSWKDEKAELFAFEGMVFGEKDL